VQRQNRIAREVCIPAHTSNRLEEPIEPRRRKIIKPIEAIGHMTDLPTSRQLAQLNDRNLEIVGVSGTHVPILADSEVPQPSSIRFRPHGATLPLTVWLRHG
jgi:hypothetical protein